MGARLLYSFAGLALVLASCGPSEDSKNNVIVVNASPNNANNTTPNNANNTTPNSIDNQMLSERDQAIYDGYNAPAWSKAAAEAALNLTVEAVVAASIGANGGTALQTTGTLTQAGQQFSFAAGPNDRLVVDWEEGPDTEIYVSQMDGDFEAETIDAFFTANHIVQARVVRDGFVDIEVGSAKNGGQREGGIEGSITQEGVTYQVDVSEVGGTSADIDSQTGNTYESTAQLTGTITAENLSLTVQEDYTYKSVYVDNFIENRSRTTNSQWTYNGVQYAVNNVFIRSAFANSYPDEEDFWRAEGTITADGVVVGQLALNQDQFKVYVLLVTDSGEQITLEEYVKLQ